MFRQRGQPGDEQRAMDAYRHAIEGGTAPAATYRNLGYLYLKQDDLAQSREQFHRYLELDPAASDRAMIEFYLEDEE
jgi:Tfp pilus assembly protein PilF